MIKADLIIGFYDASSNTSSVNDYYAFDKDICVESNKYGVCDDVSVGGTDDVIGGSVFYDGTRTTMKFTRKLDTGDITDVPIKDTVNFIFAHSADGTVDIKYHGQYKTSGVVNIQTGAFTVITAASLVPKQVHGSLMFIAWCFFLTYGGLIARFFKSKGAWWFRLHITLQMTGIILMIGAFTIAIMFTDQLGTPHFSAIHQKLGLSIVIIALLNPLLGILADVMYKPERKNTPIFPDIIHWIIGHFLILGSYVVVWLGLDVYGTTSKVCYILLCIWLAIYLAIFIVLQYKGWNKTNHEYKKGDI